MNKSTLALGALLGISVLVNVLTIGELQKYRQQPAARSETPSGAPVSEPEAEIRLPEGSRDLEPLLAELKRLSREIAALRESRGSGPDEPTDSPAAGTANLPSVVANDPVVAKLLKEQEALNKLWADLGKLSSLKKQLGDDKHRELAIKVTGEFLDFDQHTAAGFASTTGMVIQDLERARKSMQEAHKAIRYDRNDQQAYQQQYKAVQDRYNQDRDSAFARLDPYFTSDPRHQQFKANLQTWTYYVDPQSGQAGWRGER